MKKQSQFKPNFRNGQNECKLKYNKGLWQFSALRPPKKQTQSNPTCRGVASGEAGSEEKKCCSSTFCWGCRTEKIVFFKCLNGKCQFNIIAGRMSNNKTI